MCEGGVVHHSSSVMSSSLSRNHPTTTTRITHLLQDFVNVRAVGLDALLVLLSSASGLLGRSGLLGGLFGGCLGHDDSGGCCNRKVLLMLQVANL